MTDAHVASAVSGLRGLGRAGHRVLAVGPSRTAGGLWSRYAAEDAVAPSAVDEPAAFAAAVSRLALERGSPIVYPGGEAALSALTDDALELPRRPRLPYPPDLQGTLSRIRDKRMLPKLAAPAELRTATTLLEGRPDHLLAEEVPFPCVVKPAMPGGELGSARVIESQFALRELLDGLDSEAPLLVQERVTGPLVVLAVVVGSDGAPVARFQQRVHRTWPAEAGTSTLAVSVPPDDELVEQATSMLVATGYWGLAQLDFVLSDTGPVLIDVNPRFYTSLPLALACGVNLPAAWHAVAVGRGSPQPHAYRVGVTYRWLEGDLTAAVRGNLGVLRRRSPRPRAGAMWASDDPVASTMLALGAVGVRLRRRIPRGGR